MASIAQRLMFNPGNGDFSKAGALSANAEARSNKLRVWYRQGQRLFRGHNYASETEALNDFLADLPDKVAREGFLMGWNSDSYAKSNGMEYSAEGVDHQIPEGSHNGAWD